MIPLETFIQCVRQNAERVSAYELGRDGSGGTCDCIGLIIGAVRLAGEKWPGTHGSNWAARNAVGDLRALDGPWEMFPGQIVFKAKAPEDAGYDLPTAYAHSPDRLDYYHVGVVLRVSPLEIIHCTGVQGGIKRDTALGAWRWGARLKYVDYTEGEDGSMNDTVWVVQADRGGTVNLRSDPASHAPIVARVPVGSRVRAADCGESGWKAVHWNGKAGCMMEQFLKAEPETPASLEDALERWAARLEEIAADMRLYRGEEKEEGGKEA